MQTARRMITGVLTGQARSWREAARESMKGRQIYLALQQELSGPVGHRVDQLIAQNAMLIRSLPSSVAKLVTERIARRGFSGERAASSELSLLRHVARTRARLIARTETSKATTALTQARSEDLGLGWYEWKSSEDERVRISHRKMDGVLVAWDDPPSPEHLVGQRSNLGHYQAGNAPNCRCYPAPVVNVDYLRWPHRVYTGGRILMMTRVQFLRVSGLRRAA